MGLGILLTGLKSITMIVLMLDLRFGQLDPPQADFYVLLTCPINLFSTSLLSVTRFLGLSGVFLASPLESAISLRRPRSFSWRMAFRRQDLGA